MSKQLDIESPEVSIIILNWNNSALTLKCVESVQCNVSSTSYEVIIVDNGSDPLELMHLKEGLEPSSVLISLDQNLFFGGGCNIGAKAAHGRFLLFLNNDVLITPGAVDVRFAEWKDLSAGKGRNWTRSALRERCSHRGLLLGCMPAYREGCVYCV